MKSCIARWAHIKCDLASVSGSTAVTVSHDLQKLAANYTRLSLSGAIKTGLLKYSTVKKSNCDEHGM